MREQSAHRPTVGSEPIRVAYLSSFFQDANWMKPVFGLINAQDRSAFALHLFTDSAPEAIGSGYRRHDADRVHDIRRLDAAQVAEQMRSLGIDILIDLNGYSDPERLEVLTQQPCEAIVEWFNMYATSGIERVGWLIGDEAVIRPEEEAQYGESILRVPGSYLTFEPEPGVPDAATATTSDAFTFGCLASMYKFTDEVLDDWARILAKAPDSRLLLRNRGLDSRSNRERLCSRFAARGIAADRLELLPGCDHFAFLQTYERIDLALDTYPYNGGTTTTEALWQGVPVLTFDGDRWASRTSKSLLLAAGLGRFVAANRKDLVASAVAFASDARLRQELVDSRPVMRDRLKASPVCDTQSFARAMEDLYRRILGRS